MARPLRPFGIAERPMALPSVAGEDSWPALAPGIWRPVPSGRAAGLLSRARRGLTPGAAGAGLQAAFAIEVERGTPFLFVPVFLAAGAIGYAVMASEPATLPVMLAVTLLALCAWGTRGLLPLHYAAVALLLVATGVGLGKLESWRASTPMLGGSIATVLTGRVVSVETLSSGRARVTLDVLATEKPTLRYAPRRVRVSATAAAASLAPGTVVSGLVRLLPPAGPVRPGGYDVSFENYFDGIGAGGFFLRPPTVVASATTAPLAARFQAGVERLRGSIAERIAARIGGPEGQIAAALVVGVRAGIPDDVSDALRRAGIYHVISISGLHMALVAGTLMGGLRLAFALFPGFASRRPVKKLAASVALVGLAAYLFLSGGEVAAQRSFVMIAVMLTAVLFDRAALTLRNLAISAIIVLAIAPHEASGPSFQMSFAATAALVGAYAAWRDFRRDRRTANRPPRGLPGRIAEKGVQSVAGLAATSLVAGTATAVYSAWHFQQMPSLGLFTNLAAMPIVGTLVMPFAVLAALAMPFGLDGPFLDVMGFGLKLTLAIAGWFAARSPVGSVGAIAPAAVLLLTLSLLVASLATTRLRLIALPCALTGLLLIRGAPAPDILVSEDARLVAVALGDGRIAVNRPRPSAFTLQNWERAMLADTVVAPAIVRKTASQSAGGKATPRGPDAALAQLPSGSEQPPTGGGAQDADRAPSARTIPTDHFVCADGLCLIRQPAGVVIALADDRAAADRACPLAGLVVVTDPAAPCACASSDARVITARDLAQRGSAAIRLSEIDQPAAGGALAPVPADVPAEAAPPAGDAAGDATWQAAGTTAPLRPAARSRPSLLLTFAIAEPYRPWHASRRFSREARGLPAYQSRRGAAPPSGRSSRGARSPPVAEDPAITPPGQPLAAHATLPPAETAADDR